MCICLLHETKCVSTFHVWRIYLLYVPALAERNCMPLHASVIWSYREDIRMRGHDKTGFGPSRLKFHLAIVWFTLRFRKPLCTGKNTTLKMRLPHLQNRAGASQLIEGSYGWS
jgi:hypothetical protein